MNNVFFDSWESIFRTIIITILAYVALIVLLRTFGKRTLSKMNAFDLVVTIALGSTLATVMLNKSIALADGVLAFFLLMGLQFLISSMSFRFSWVNRLVKSTPTLLVYRGEKLLSSMKSERINDDEIKTVMRQNGCSSLSDVYAIVLETDGSLTFMGKSAGGKTQAMTGVKGYDAEKDKEGFGRVKHAT